MLAQKKKEINGVTYLVTQMAARKAIKTQLRLVKILGSNIFTILQSVQAGGTFKLENLLAELKPLLDNFDDAVVFDFVESLIDTGVFIQKTDGATGIEVPIKLDIDTHFNGRLNDLWLLAAFVLEVNFAVKK